MDAVRSDEAHRVPAGGPPGTRKRAAAGSAFEQRMRSRRADTCVRVARQAIVEGRLADARQRLEEACEIDPDAAEPRLLLEELRGPSNRVEAGTNAATRHGAGWSHWLAAAVAILVLAALAFFWPEAQHPRQESPARREPSTPAVDLPASVRAVPLEPAPLPADRAPDLGAARTPAPIGTAGRASSAAPERVEARTEPPSRTAAEATSPVPTTPSGIEAAPSPAVAAMAAVATADPAGIAPHTATSVPENLPGGIRLSSDALVQPTPVAPGSTPVGGGRAETDPAPASLRKPPPPTDQEMIAATLGRYADAYAKLDAKAAQRVWPTVDAAALQRAFGGLHAQRVVFEHCDLDISGAVARAACRGQARYVPKVGSHDPLTESRTWVFTLLKDESDWKIKSAEVK